MGYILSTLGPFIVIISAIMTFYYLTKLKKERWKDEGNPIKYVKKSSYAFIIFVIGMLLAGVDPDSAKVKAEKEELRKAFLEQRESDKASEEMEFKERKDKEFAFAKTLEAEWGNYGEIRVDPKGSTFYLIATTAMIGDLTLAINDPHNYLKYWEIHKELAQEFYFDVNNELATDNRNYNVIVLSPMNEDVILLKVESGLITYDRRLTLLK